MYTYIYKYNTRKIFILGTYVKVNETACSTPYETTAKFDTIDQAKSACSADSNCVAVFDNDCDESAQDIFLCSLNSTISESETGDCIYKKNLSNIL